MKKIKSHVLSAVCLSFICAPIVTCQSANAADANPVVFDRGFGEVLSANLTGSYAVKIGDSKMAARAFELAWLNDRTNYGAFKNSIKAYLIAGDLDKALKLAKMGNQKLRGSDAELVIANDEFKKGNLKPILAYDNYVELSESRALYARHLKAWAMALSGDKTAAIDMIAQKSGIRNIDKNAYFSRAIMLQFLGDNEGAKSAYETAYGLGGRTIIGVTNYARFLAQTGHKDDALDVLRATDNVSDVIVLNDVYNEIKNSSKASKPNGKIMASLALANIAQSIAYDNKSGSPLGELSMSLSLNKDLQIIKIDIARFQNALDLEDDANAQLANVEKNSVYGDIASSINSALLYPKDEKAAIENLQKTAKIRPNFFNQSSLANYYIASERFKDAQLLYDKLIDQSKGLSEQAMGAKKWQLFFGRSNAFTGLKNPQAAIKDLRAANDLEPDNPLLLNSLGYILADNNVNLDEARKLLEKAVQLRPQSGETIDSLGWLMFRQGEYEEAIDRLEFAMMLAPNIGEIAEHLGDAYWTTNRKEEAKLEWSKAISLTKSSDDKARISSKMLKGIDIPAAKAIVAQSQ